MTEYLYTPPSEVFQFDDVTEVLGVRNESGHTQRFAMCASKDIARFIMDVCNAEINRRSNQNQFGPGPCPIPRCVRMRGHEGEHELQP